MAWLLIEDVENDSSSNLSRKDLFCGTHSLRKRTAMSNLGNLVYVESVNKSVPRYQSFGHA